MKQTRQKADPSPSWKAEVNRRIAEHKERKGEVHAEQETPQEVHPAGSLAAIAAARVAARYAKAPSYSQMLAEEARAAVRAAEAASRDALNAHAKAEAVLAEIEAVAAREPDWDSERQASVPEEIELPQAIRMDRSIPVPPAMTDQPANRNSFEIRWDSDLPVRDSALATARPVVGDNAYAAPAGPSWNPAMQAASAPGADDVEMVEGAQPIHANLIKFPRELVAARKARPRRAEGPYASMIESQGQLSIFEVEPWNISTEPQPAAGASAASDRWVGPEWSDIELDEQPQQQNLYPPVDDSPYAAAGTALPEAAPINHRVLAAIVDFSLIVMIFLAAGLIASSASTSLPSMKAVEFGSVFAVAIVALLYHLAFFSISGVTPGMLYARLQLTTFDGQKPSLRQRCYRAAALLLSIMPMGLGAVWVLFDENRFCWHDRLSGTYLRK